MKREDEATYTWNMRYCLRFEMLKLAPSTEVLLPRVKTNGACISNVGHSIQQVYFRALDSVRYSLRYDLWYPSDDEHLS